MELKGKKVVFLGDSITEGVGVSNLENRYDNRLKKMLSLGEAVNFGLSGTRFAYQTKPSSCPSFDLYFCGRSMNMDKDADVVIVYGAVNDYIHGDAPFGTEDDRLPFSFRGATHRLMKYLTEEYKGKPIVFMTPARCHFAGFSDEEVSKNTLKAPDAKPLLEYVDIINNTAKLYGVHVLDLYRNLPINPNIPEDSDKYTTDGLHFNDEGHRVLAETLADFLKKI
ncbi:MAG: SGNH/GDSL hydrolase family protein [Clostridia bacterium]|nr:SGNH/GDSL hydrolase family protein [Clostridia bacterium]